ncbi:MAG: sigma-70 family RNA polymerase sigma factor [Bacteroidetes bacterium]|nr:sigma-70 family RNA polymerase sigma factor [Bacteroidota bacterium]
MKNFEKITDQEIINRILSGEKSFYEIIIRRFNPYLYKIGRSYNYDHDDTQDLMQDTYIDAYKNLHQFEQRSNFKTWITRIMLNNCYRKREKTSRKNEVSQEHVPESEMMGHASNNVSQQINNNELRRIIEEALSKIPEEYRMVFSLREISEYNTTETAELLQISEANVKVRLNRAKAMLQSYLKSSYNTVQLFEFNLTLCNPFTERVMNQIQLL